MDSAKLYNLLFDAAPDAIIVINTDGKIILCNDQITSLFGYGKEELNGESIEILIPDRLAARHKGHREAYHYKPIVREMGALKELSAKRKDGTEFFVEVSLSPIRYDEEVLTAAAIRDVSEKIKVNRRLKDSLAMIEAKNNELEQFTYIASHDLQEPLRTIVGIVDLLSKGNNSKLTSTELKSLDYLVKVTGRMSELIKGLLDYGRIGHNHEKTTVDCQELLEEVRHDLSSSICKYAATLEVGELPTVYGYKIEMRLLFQNLISNALKFHRADVPPTITIAAVEKETCWEFSVADNGIGISEEHQERIFRIFQRLHSRAEFEGTGIGLAHCRKIVELHGGKMWLHSKTNQGSTFYFTIPKP